MREELIISITYQKFSEKGYSTSLNEIAKEAGIKKQSIYNYYPDKETLFFEMIKGRIEVYYEFLEAEYQKNITKTPLDCLKSMYITIAEYFKNRTKLNFIKRLLLIEDPILLGKVKEYLKSHDIIFSKRLHNNVKDIVKSDLDEDRVWQYVQNYMVMLHGTLDGILLFDDTIDVKQFAMNNWNMFFKGIEKDCKNL